MSTTATIDDSFSNTQNEQSNGGFFKALAKGAVSFYEGIQDFQPTTTQENSYDWLGADVAPNLRFLRNVYVSSSHLRVGQKLTPEAVKDFYDQSEVSHGVTAGRTKYISLAERRESERKKILGKSFSFAYYSRHR